MIRKIFFILATAGLASCSTYSGPEYYTAGPDMKQNMGGYDPATYSEDISMMSFYTGTFQHMGTSPAKAKKNVENGKTVVGLEYEFPRNGKAHKFYMTIPDYMGVGVYKDTINPVTITFLKVKEYPEEVIQEIWKSDKTILVEVVKADKKYIEVKFEGKFNIFNSSDEITGTAYVAEGVIRNMWQR